MSGVPASSRGFNGGTITDPLVIQGTPGTGDNLLLVYNDVRPIATPDSEAFAVTGDGSVYFRSGSGSIALNIVSQDGLNLLNYRSGFGLVTVAGGATVHSLFNTTLGFYGHTPAAQAAAIPNASGGAIQDAEARTALNALLAAMRAIGLIAT